MSNGKIRRHKQRAKRMTASNAVLNCQHVRGGIAHEKLQKQLPNIVGQTGRYHVKMKARQAVILDIINYETGEVTRKALTRKGFKPTVGVGDTKEGNSYFHVMVNSPKKQNPFRVIGELVACFVGIDIGETWGLDELGFTYETDQVYIATKKHDHKTDIVVRNVSYWLMPVEQFNRIDVSLIDPDLRQLLPSPKLRN